MNSPQSFTSRAIIAGLVWAGATFTNILHPSEAKAAGITLPVTTPNRSVYLNGVDISSARNQDLRNVHVKISDNGDIFIAAPQYQVTEEETFMPLSTFGGKANTPDHKPPQAMNSAAPAKSPSPTGVMASDKSATPSPAAAAPAQPASSATPKTGE